MSMNIIRWCGRVVYESKAFGEKLLGKIIKGNGEKVKILDGI